MSYLLRTSEQDYREALGQFVSAFPAMPAALMMDILARRVQLHPDEHGNVEFDWIGPMGTPTDYLYDWKTVFFTVTGAKKAWLQAVLDLRHIPFRDLSVEGRTNPVVQVPVDKAQEAHRLLMAEVAGRRIQDYRDDDPIFEEDGAAWSLDNVNEV